VGWGTQQFNKISYLVVVGALEVLSDSLDEERFEEDREQSDWNHERLEQQNNGTECLQHNTHILDYCKPRQCLWCYHHDQSHCESSPGSSDECRHPASQTTWAASPPKIGSYRPHPPSPLLLLLSP